MTGLQFFATCLQLLSHLARNHLAKPHNILNTILLKSVKIDFIAF